MLERQNTHLDPDLDLDVDLDSAPGSSPGTSVASGRGAVAATGSNAPTDSIRWHRPLLWPAALMGVVLVGGIIGSIVDDHVITGVDGWFKPIKFALSIGIYSVTLSWLFGQLTRFRRLTWWAGTIIVVTLLIEMIIIVGAAAVGTTSHFNVSTPFHAALWAIMGISIATAWVMTFLIAIPLFVNQLGDRARGLAIRGGMVIGLIGIGLAFLMTIPSAEQRVDGIQGIAGAHTVGLPDGRPGLFFLGWSTVGGDLRIPHFIGMHALQVIPLLAFAMEAVARRAGGPLASPVVRFRLVAVALLTYAAALADLTFQALAGQSVVHPGGPYLVAGVVIVGGAVVAVVVVLRAGRAPRRSLAR